MWCLMKKNVYLCLYGVVCGRGGTSLRLKQTFLFPKQVCTLSCESHSTAYIICIVIGTPLKALSNQPKLTACCHFQQIWASQSSSRLSAGVFSVLITSYLAHCTIELAEATGRWGAQLRRSDSGWWQKPGEEAAERRLQASMPGMTEAVMERARDPWGGAEERGRACSRENSPQACVVELKHPYANLKHRHSECWNSQSFATSSFWGIVYWLAFFILLVKSLWSADWSIGKT